jgi:hypothetical protein
VEQQIKKKLGKREKATSFIASFSSLFASSLSKIGQIDMSIVCCLLNVARRGSICEESAENKRLSGYNWGCRGI